MTGRAGVLKSGAAGLLLAVTGCSVIPGLAPSPTARPCADVFGEDRCQLIGDAAADQQQFDRSDIVELLILPEPTPEPREGGGVILSARSGPGYWVRVTLADGGVTTVALCGGISSMFVPACMDEPHLRAVTATNAGYWDVPCPDPPVSCATRHPDPDPKTRAAATWIDVPSVRIPIDRVGAHEIRVGAGSLPNGILTDASFEFADDWPTGLSIGSGEVALVVRSLEPGGRPFQNYYDHGWSAGLERIEAVLAFDVTRFEPGATLDIRNVVIR